MAANKIHNVLKYTPFKKSGDGTSYTPKLGEPKSSEHLKRLKQWGKTRGKYSS